MLRNHEESCDLSLAPARRLLAAALLAGIAAGVWMMPPPVQGGDDKRTAQVAKATSSAPVTRSDTPAFDLSYIPDDAMGLFAFHPAAIIHRQGMARYAGQLNALAAMERLDIGLGLGTAISKCPLKLEQIEQYSAAISFGRTVQQGKEMRRINVHGFMIRTIEPFDWVKLIRSTWPDAVESDAGNKLYIKVKFPELGLLPCFYVPDNRTLVFDQEPFLLQLMRYAPAPPEFARGDDWKKVEHDLFAVILDNHRGRISQATRKVMEIVDEDDPIGPFIEPTNRWVMGLADADDFLVRLLATCRNPRSTQTTAKLVEGAREDWLKGLQAIDRKAPKGTEYNRLLTLVNQILRGLRVEAGHTSVTVEPGGGVRLADLLTLLVKDY